MRVLVCGGRKYSDWKRVCAVLDELHKQHGIEMVIHGDAAGADYHADQWAKNRSVKPVPYPAKWNDLSFPDANIRRGKGGKLYDTRAGSRRNQEMLDKERIDLVVAFPGGNGTADMVRKSRTAGIEVLIVHDDLLSVSQGEAK